MSKQFLHMQKLAGLITESEYKKLNENQDSPTHKSKVDWYYINDNSDYPGPKGRTVPDTEGYDNPQDYKGTELYIAKGTKGYVSGNKFEDEDGNDVKYEAEYFEKLDESLTESKLKNKIKELVHASLGEAKKKKKEPSDVAPQEDVDIDIEEPTSDIDTPTDTMSPEVSAEIDIDPKVKAIQDSLSKALANAKALGDEKLVNQIGNTITMLVRTQVVGQQAVAENLNEDLTEEDTQKLVGMFIDMQEAIEMPFEMGMEFETTDEEYNKLMAARKVARQLEIKYGGKKYGIGAIMPDNK